MRLQWSSVEVKARPAHAVCKRGPALHTPTLPAPPVTCMSHDLDLCPVIDALVVSMDVLAKAK